jgi:hypothetical protein
MFGYASSMTRTPPSVPTPSVRTMLQGLERAALLQGFPAKMGIFVQMNEPIAAVAFAKGGEVNVGKLNRQRYYRSAKDFCRDVIETHIVRKMMISNRLGARTALDPMRI